MSDKKPGARHGRKPRRGERAKRNARRKKRARAWEIADDGAGPRDIAEPGRHHRR